MGLYQGTTVTSKIYSKWVRIEFDNKSFNFSYLEGVKSKVFNIMLIMIKNTDTEEDAR